MIIKSLPKSERSCVMSFWISAMVSDETSTSRSIPSSLYLIGNSSRVSKSVTVFDHGVRRYSLCDACLQRCVIVVKVAIQMLERSVGCSAQHAHDLDTASLHTRNIDPHLGQGRVVRGNIIDSDIIGVAIFAVVQMEGSKDEMGRN